MLDDTDQPDPFTPAGGRAAVSLTRARALSNLAGLVLGISWL